MQQGETEKLNGARIAEALNVSRSQICRYRKMGCPVDQGLEAVKEWRTKNIKLGFEDKTPDGVVYFVRCGNFVKIGWTTNLDQRINPLSTSNPLTMELIAWVDGGRALERDLHLQFADPPP
jgi:hypothetical protein